MAKTNAREVVDEILGGLGPDWSVVEAAYKKRIFRDLKTTSGASIDSASHLHKTGFLEKSISIDATGITVAVYYEGLEKLYGVIFDLSDEEITLIETLWTSRILTD